MGDMVVDKINYLFKHSTFRNLSEIVIGICFLTLEKLADAKAQQQKSQLNSFVWKNSVCSLFCVCKLIGFNLEMSKSHPVVSSWVGVIQPESFFQASHCELNVLMLRRKQEHVNFAEVEVYSVQVAVHFQ